MQPAIVEVRGIKAWRYAQEKRGQKLHVAEMFANQTVARVSACGRRPARRWRLTSNMPFGEACGRCIRIMLPEVRDGL